MDFLKFPFTISGGQPQLPPSLTNISIVSTVNLSQVRNELTSACHNYFSHGNGHGNGNGSVDRISMLLERAKTSLSLLFSGSNDVASSSNSYAVSGYDCTPLYHCMVGKGEENALKVTEILLRYNSEGKGSSFPLLECPMLVPTNEEGVNETTSIEGRKVVSLMSLKYPSVTDLVLSTEAGKNSCNALVNDLLSQNGNDAGLEPYANVVLLKHCKPDASNWPLIQRAFSSALKISCPLAISIFESAYYESQQLTQPFQLSESNLLDWVQTCFKDENDGRPIILEDPPFSAHHFVFLVHEAVIFRMVTEDPNVFSGFNQFNDFAFRCFYLSGENSIPTTILETVMNRQLSKRTLPEYQCSTFNLTFYDVKLIWGLIYGRLYEMAASTRLGYHLSPVDSKPCFSLLEEDMKKMEPQYMILDSYALCRPFRNREECFSRLLPERWDLAVYLNDNVNEIMDLWALDMIVASVASTDPQNRLIFEMSFNDRNLQRIVEKQGNWQVRVPEFIKRIECNRARLFLSLDVEDWEIRQSIVLGLMKHNLGITHNDIVDSLVMRDYISAMYPIDSEGQQCSYNFPESILLALKFNTSFMFYGRFPSNLLVEHGEMVRAVIGQMNNLSPARYNVLKFDVSLKVAFLKRVYQLHGVLKVREYLTQEGNGQKWWSDELLQVIRYPDLKQLNLTITDFSFKDGLDPAYADEPLRDYWISAMAADDAVRPVDQLRMVLELHAPKADYIKQVIGRRFKFELDNCTTSLEQIRTLLILKAHFFVPLHATILNQTCLIKVPFFMLEILQSSPTTHDKIDHLLAPLPNEYIVSSLVDKIASSSVKRKILGFLLENRMSSMEKFDLLKAAIHAGDLEMVRRVFETWKTKKDANKDATINSPSAFNVTKGEEIGDLLGSRNGQFRQLWSHLFSRNSTVIVNSPFIRVPGMFIQCLEYRTDPKDVSLLIKQVEEGFLIESVIPRLKTLPNLLGPLLYALVERNPSFSMKTRAHNLWSLVALVQDEKLLRLVIAGKTSDPVNYQNAMGNKENPLNVFERVGNTEMMRIFLTENKERIPPFEVELGKEWINPFQMAAKYNWQHFFHSVIDGLMAKIDHPQRLYKLLRDYQVESKTTLHLAIEAPNSWQIYTNLTSIIRDYNGTMFRLLLLTDKKKLTPFQYAALKSPNPLAYVSHFLETFGWSRDFEFNPSDTSSSEINSTAVGNNTSISNSSTFEMLLADRQRNSNLIEYLLHNVNFTSIPNRYLWGRSLAAFKGGRKRELKLYLSKFNGTQLSSSSSNGVRMVAFRYPQCEDPIHLVYLAAIKGDIDMLSNLLVKWPCSTLNPNTIVNASGKTLFHQLLLDYLQQARSKTRHQVLSIQLQKLKSSLVFMLSPQVQERINFMQPGLSGYNVIDSIRRHFGGALRFEERDEMLHILTEAQRMRIKRIVESQVEY